MAGARTEAEVAGAALDHGLEAFGADAGWLVVPDGPHALVTLGSRGYAEEQLAAWARLDPGADVPIAEAFRAGQAIYLEDRIALADRYPRLAAGGTSAWQGLAALPLVVDGRSIGAIGLSFRAPRRLAAFERDDFAWLSQKCAQALDRARSADAERRAREEAIRIGALQEQLLAVVSHDLRTPLTAVSMSAAGLLRRPGLPEDQRPALLRITHGASRMNAIIRDLLDFSRLRQGMGLPLRPERTDLAALARVAIQELEASGATARVELSVEGEVSLEADTGRLTQALSNLVGNALQHGAGSPVRVQVAGLADGVTVSIRNGGPAIPPEVLPHLFEPFRRGAGRDQAGERAGSVGLGLFIVREILRAHHGSIEVSSSEAEGTCFAARLPRR
jgi:signal transduction histidine kinase